MIKNYIVGSLLGMLVLFIAGCQNESEEVFSKPQQENEIDALKDEIAVNVVSLLQENSARKTIISSLQQNKVGVALNQLIQQLEGQNTKVNEKSALKNIVTKTGLQYTGVEEPDQIYVPELFLFESDKSITAENLLVTFAPEGDVEHMQQVKAYTLNMDVVYLDPNTDPEYNVVVVETEGFAALQVKAAYMNKMLQKHGLQAATPVKVNGTSRNGVETTIMDKIRLKDDEEPWIKGAAEIYAVTSGIRNANNRAEVNVIPMYYLDHDDETYYPNQIMLFWDDYAYQAANIQLFEQDSNYNYKDLVGIIVNGIASIVGDLSGQPWVSALGQIASAVINALPDNWYTDDDDYVDSFYTVEKTKTYTNHYGARRNAQVSMRPYFIPANN